MTTLHQTLMGIQTQMATQVPAEILSAFGTSLQQLIIQKPEEKALKVGDIAPNFTVMLNHQETTLSTLLKTGPVVLNFFRGNWCPFCMAELEHYQSILVDIEVMPAQFLFISPQKSAHHTALTTEKGLDLQFVSDMQNTIAKQFGLVFQLEEEIQAIYKAMGADLSQFNGDDSFELPMPATYVIEPSGKISYAFVEPNYMVRAELAEVLSRIG